MRPLIISNNDALFTSLSLFRGVTRSRNGSSPVLARATYANYRRVNSAPPPPSSLVSPIASDVIMHSNFHRQGFYGSKRNITHLCELISSFDVKGFLFFLNKCAYFFLIMHSFFQRRNSVAAIARTHHYSQRMPTPNKFSFRN